MQIRQNPERIIIRLLGFISAPSNGFRSLSLFYYGREERHFKILFLSILEPCSHFNIGVGVFHRGLSKECFDRREKKEGPVSSSQ
jgi:hypothetical protein